MVRQWAKTNLRSDFLEFVLLAMPLDSWKEVADLVHLRPSDFCVSYFLEELYRDDKGVDSPLHFVSTMRQFVNEAEDNSREAPERFLDIAQEFPQVFLQYPLIRRYPKLLGNKEIMEQCATHAPLDTVIWYFEEFHQASKRSRDMVLERMKRNDGAEHSLTKSKVTNWWSAS